MKIASSCKKSDVGFDTDSLSIPMKELQKPCLYFSGPGKSPSMAKPTSVSSHVDQERKISRAPGSANVESVLINGCYKYKIIEWEKRISEKEHNSMQPNRGRRIMES